MELKNVKITNFKGIKFVDVATDSNMIVISGNNGAGKSSFCDAIMDALQGKDRAIVKPIREGEKSAIVEIELDGYTISKVTREKGTDLKIIPDGKTRSISSPQKWLNDHISELKLDPSEFSRMPEKDKRELLIKLADIDLTEYDKAIEEAMEERKQAKRDLAVMELPTDEQIDLAMENKNRELVNVQELNERYSANQNLIGEYTRARAEIEANEKSIAELQIRITQLSKRNEELEQVKEVDDLGQELMEQLKNIEATNDLIKNSKTVIEKATSYRNKETHINQQTTIINNSREAKKQALAVMELPLKGLTVDDEGVFFNGIPFAQVNDSQQIVIGTMLAISLAPKDDPIKLAFIKLGSLLDDKAMTFLEKFAIDNNAQIIVEFVGEGKGFTIREGEIIN